MFAIRGVDTIHGLLQIVKKDFYLVWLKFAWLDSAADHRQADAFLLGLKPED